MDNEYYKMTTDSIKLFFLKKEYHYVVGDTLREVELDNFDNNLNGIIDELRLSDKYRY